MAKNAAPRPLESDEQKALFEWAGIMQGRYPELRLLHHIPNGGKRSKREAAMLKAEGVKAGIPDLFLPVARSVFHGLYIELKRIGGVVSPIQKQWLQDLTAEGYRALVCIGWEDAAHAILDYLQSSPQGVDI